MANIFEVLDFPNTFFGAERSLYNAQRSGVKTREEVGIKDYLSRDVDFYSTGLAKSTGINVSDPDRWSDEDEDGKEEDKNQINVNVVGGSDNNETDATGPIGSDLSSGLSENISVNSGMASLGTGYTPYGQSLQNAGFGDRSNSFLSQNFGISLAADMSKQGAKSSLSNMTTAKSLAERAAKTTMSVLGFNPIGTNLLSGFVTGRTVQDPLGNPSYRPNHSVLGTAMDVNYSIQSTNIGASIAAMNANAGKPLSQRSPVGFFGYVNGQVVSKGPMGNWTGTTSLSNTQLDAMDALSKGYAPLGYDSRTERGTREIVGNTTSATTGWGGYDKNGYHHSINGTAAQGSMAQASVAASKAGITTSQMVTALKEARKNRTWMGKTIDQKKTLDFQIQKQFRDHSSSQSGSGSMGLETDVNAQKGIQDALSKGTGVNEFGGVSQDTLSDVQSINASNPGIGTSTGAGAVGSSGGLGGGSGVGTGQGSPNSGEGADSDGPGGAGDSSAGAGEYKKGGFIGKKNFALGGRGDAEPAGFIGGTPEQFDDQTTIADDIPLKVQDGTFVINAPAVEYAGSSDIQKMLAEGYQKAMTRDVGNGYSIKTGKIPNREELDIQISRGEVVVPPHVATVIGYDRLEKINNRGKREVERRQQKAGDQEKVRAGQGFAAGGGEQGLLFRRPDLKLTSPNIDKYQDSFVPGISDKPVEITPDDENFFDAYSLRDIKESIFDKEMRGYKDKGYIFTGVRAKTGKGSSAFGTMQITYSTLEDFINRGKGFKQFSPELQEYTKNVAQQGRDKVNIEINKGIYREGKKIPLNKIPKKVRAKLSRLGQGVIPQEVHKKYYSKLADEVLRQKLKDYKNKGIRPFLESYGEGEQYGEDVYNILLDKIQTKNSSATQ
jgi:hypothetical protein